MQRNAEGEPPSLESLPTSSSGALAQGAVPAQPAPTPISAVSGSPLPEHAVAGNKRQREDDFESLPSLDALKDFILRGEMVDLPLSLDLQDLADFDVRDDDAHQARLRDLQAQTNDIWLHHLEKKQEEFWNDINKQVRRLPWASPRCPLIPLPRPRSPSRTTDSTSAKTCLWCAGYARSRPAHHTAHEWSTSSELIACVDSGANQARDEDRIVLQSSGAHGP